MSVWVIHEQLTPEQEENIRQRPYVVLPFDNLPDLAEVREPAHVKHLLQLLHPDDPPETIIRLQDRYWKYFRGIHPEDLIAVPLLRRKEVAIAEVTGDYEYITVQGREMHTVPVKWHEKGLKGPKISRNAALFKFSGERMLEVTEKEARVMIRDCLPHAYNRFAKWKWLVVIFFAWQVFQMLMSAMKH